MVTKIGINGFGRIGRLITRILALGHPNLELVAINSQASSFDLGHLLKYDSVHRTFDSYVTYDGNFLTVDNNQIVVTHIASPRDIPWKELGVDIVLETTGRFTQSSDAHGHLDAGVKKVIIGASGKGVDATLVMGVNHFDYDPKNHHIISNASCTTNCLAPVTKVLNDVFGIEHGLMTTIHSYTMSQRILDGSHKDIRRARAAAMSIIPTTTGAAQAVAQVIPDLTNKLDGFAIRVPTPNVSLVDFTCRLKHSVTIKKVNDAFKEASCGFLDGILEITTIPLVSVDYTSSPFSSVVDASLTQIIDGRLVKVVVWYDNEMGFTHRIIDLASYMASMF